MPQRPKEIAAGEKMQLKDVLWVLKYLTLGHPSQSMETPSYTTSTIQTQCLKSRTKLRGNFYLDMYRELQKELLSELEPS